MAGRCGCQRSCTCCATTTPSIAVGGSGAAGACFAPQVRYSTDAGNRARPGSDGAVYADTCLLGPDGNPLTPDENGCVQLPAPCILDYNGDPITPDGDGCIQLPTNGAPPAFGCGLMTDEGGELMVAASAADYGDLTDLSGAGFGGDELDAGAIICAADGLRGLPDHTAVEDGVSSELYDGLLAIAATYTSASIGTATITNPSNARSMLVMRTIRLTVDLSLAIDGDCVVQIERNVDGGGFGVAKTGRWPVAEAGGRIRYRGDLTLYDVGTIAPASSQTLAARMLLTNAGTGDDPALIYAFGSIQLVGVTV